MLIFTSNPLISSNRKSNSKKSRDNENDIQPYLKITSSVESSVVFPDDLEVSSTGEEDESSDSE